MFLFYHIVFLAMHSQQNIYFLFPLKQYLKYLQFVFVPNPVLYFYLL